MEALRKLAKKTKRLSMQNAMRALLKDKELQDFVIQLNTEEQLFEGINAEGESLADIGGEYREKTKRIKEKKGQPTDRVTLFDTGEFYESFFVKAGKDAFSIIADTIKEDEDLQLRWGSELLGLTDYSKDQLILKMIPLIRLYVKEKLLR